MNTTNIVGAWRKQGIAVNPPETDVVYLVRCPNCQFEQWQPAWLGNRDFYAQLSSFSWYYESDKWEYRAAIQWMGKDARVLEIGCGEGNFLKLMATKGIYAVGLDTNINAVQTALSHNLNAVDSDVAEYAKSSEELFDVVCHFQVLEHIPEPMPFLKTCARLLKPGGKLMIATPNQDSFFRHAPFPLLDMPPHHQSHWTVSAYQTASEKLKLRVTNISYQPLNRSGSRWAFQCLVNRYLRIGIKRPHSGVAYPLLKGAVLHFIGLLGQVVLCPKWVHSRIRGPSILVCIQKPG